jgi:hypothetical protein
MMIRTKVTSLYYPVTKQRVDGIRGGWRVRQFRDCLVLNRAKPKN